MKKKQVHKLELRRNTVTNLARQVQVQVRGGAGTQPISVCICNITPQCPTNVPGTTCPFTCGTCIISCYGTCGENTCGNTCFDSCTCPI
jgi:hypothetical protein